MSQHQLAEAHRVAARGLGKLSLILATSRGKKSDIQEIIDALKAGVEILQEVVRK